MKIRNVDKLLPQIRLKLLPYLQEKNFIIKPPHLQCPHGFIGLNHKNNDKGKLSAAFIPDTNNTKIKCFVENQIFDIFDVYSLIEKKPLYGEGFYIIIEELCKKYGIPYEKDIVQSPKEIEILKKKEFITKFHTFCLKNAKNGAAHYKKRKLTRQQIIAFKIGFIDPKQLTQEWVTAFDKYLGYKINLILTAPALVIPIYNKFKQYVGVTLRQYTEDEQRRYLHLYADRDRVMYNVNNIHSKEEVYIVEGSFDAVALYPELPAIACLTSSVQNGGIEYLAKEEFKQINLALDPDLNEKDTASNGILKSILNLKDLDTQLYIIDIPKKYDPDSFVKEKGIEEFKKLKKLEAIDYLIKKRKENSLSDNKLYEFIASCPNIVRKEHYISKVSESLGVGKRALTKEIEKIGEKDTTIDLVRYIEEKEFMSVTLNRYIKQALSGDFVGVPSGFKLFDKYFGGFEDTIYLWIGFAQAGKSTFLLNFALRLLMNEKNFVALYSIDDGLFRSVIPRMLSMLTGLPSREMRNPTTKENKEILVKGAKKLLQLKENFTMKDGSHINTLWGDMEEFAKIHKTIAEKKNKKFIMIIDNIHALTMSHKHGETENAQRIAVYLKKLVQRYECPLLCTGEVPKSANERPTGKDVKQSNEFEYGARVIGSIISAPRNANQKTKYPTDHLWHNYKNNLNPIMELNISKNQTFNTWHGSLFYKFYIENNRLKECTEEEQAMLRSKTSII